MFGSRRRPPLCVAAAFVIGAVTLFPAATTAQEDPAATTSTTTSTTSQPPVPSSSTTTSTTSTTQPAPTDDPTADEEAPPESVPDVDITLPPSLDPSLPLLVRIDGAEITAALDEATAAVADARTRVEDLTGRLAELERAMARVDLAHEDAVAEAAAAREDFDRRVAGAYVRGDASGLAALVTAADVIDLEIAHTLLASAAEADLDAAARYIADRETLEEGLVRLVDAVVATRADLRTARADLRLGLEAQQLASYRYAIFAAGSDLVIDGFVFPVAEPYNFIDSWGYPRMIGTEYAHGHQGVDIMAPFGTALYACERGVITRVGTDTLGGIKLWLRGESGTSYYYAHLQSYEDGIAAGTVVEAGQVVGRVGDTGNARGGAPHLHFQVHPGGGEPVNPYPLLHSVSSLGT